MRLLATALVLALGLAAGAAAQAQAPERVWRVALLTGASPRSAAFLRGLDQRLAELGYVEGRNLVLDFRTAGGQMDRLPALAAELVGRRPDVFLAVSTRSAVAAKNATQTIPIVLGAVGDPVGTGIAPSLARPEGNTAASRRLPVIYPFREMVKEGGLLCYGPSLTDSLRTAADYVDKIFKGARPGDLPIAQPTRFDLIVNLKTAKALGLTIPQSVLVRADDVIR
jgi:ABC-type uncharacterized transport system substrate-binding protein